MRKSLINTVKITMRSDFSKYELYTSCKSTYCYENSNVLINKLDIHDNILLKNAEAEVTIFKLKLLSEEGVTGRFTFTHLKNIHKFIFEDIYHFAGKYRTEQIGKSDTWFYPPTIIDESVKKLLNRLKGENNLRKLPENNFVERLSYYMAELNAIHPFREENGRTIREFVRQLALYNGYELDWSSCEKDDILKASILSYDDYTALEPILSQCLAQ